MVPSATFDSQRVLRLAAETFDIEARALLGLKARQGDDFVKAVAAVLESRGRVVVMGMGKSGHVGRKIAATLASTGTPAMFVHPAEASHGDLGMVTPGDVVLAISNSGESDELAAVMPAIRRLGVTLIAMTGRAESTLLQARDALLADQLKWADLAASVGFADQAHLSREFRRITGLSPRELSALLTQESYWMSKIWT